MQPLARDGLTAAQVRGLLTMTAPVVEAGAELLDPGNAVVADISEHLLGGVVERHTSADVHGSCRLSLTCRLDWPTARVRPFLVVSDGRPGYGDVIRASGPVLFVRADEGLSAAGSASLSPRDLPPVSTPRGFTVALWCQAAGNWRAAVRLRHATLLGGVQIGSTLTGDLTARVLSTGGQVDLDTGVSLRDGWHHVALSSDGSTVRLFADGAQVASTALLGSLPPGFDEVRLGRGWTLPEGEAWTGMLDEVAVWDRPLPASEVASHAAAGPGPLSARFDLGVFRVQTPTRDLGEDPPTFDVSGMDLLSLLQDPVGDTWVVDTGTGYLTAVRAALTAAGITSPVLLDGVAQDKALASPMVWCLTESDPATWLRVVNDLLSAVGYRGLWVDERGTFRSEPYATPVSRPVEWVFDRTDPASDITEPEASVEVDVWRAPNVWRFVRKQDTTPVLGNGIVDITNAHDGPLSVDSIGVVRAPVAYLDVADHAALVAEADRLVQEARQVVTTMTLHVGRLPVLGHADVVQIVDPSAGGLVKAQVASWSQPLDGSPVTVTVEVLGG